MAIAGPTTDHEEIRPWAESHAAVPVEVLPAVVDGEPALLRLMLKEQAGDRPNVRVIGWEEFFCKFDALGLTLVYANDSTGYNETSSEKNTPRTATLITVRKLLKLNFHPGSLARPLG